MCRTAFQSPLAWAKARPPAFTRSRTHANTDGSLWVACRVSLPLPSPPVPSPDAPASAAVFVPDRVWTDPDSRKVRPGETIVFTDFAVNRQAASRKLGATGTDTSDDYTLRVTLTPMPAAAAPPVAQP